MMQYRWQAQGKVNFGLVIAFLVFIVFTLLFYGRAFFSEMPGIGVLIYHAEHAKAKEAQQVAVALSAQKKPAHYELRQVEILTPNEQHDTLVLHFTSTLPDKLPHITDNHKIILSHTQLAQSFQPIAQLSDFIKAVKPVQETDQLILDLTLAKQMYRHQIDKHDEERIIRLSFHHVEPSHSLQQVAVKEPLIKKKEIIPTPAEQAEQAYQHSLNAANSGNLSQAMQLAEQALTHRSDHHDARQMLILSALQIGAKQVAEKALDQGLVIDPHYGPFVKMKARRLMDKHDPKAALVLLKASQAQWDHDVEYNALLAVLYQQVGQYAQAGRLYHRLLKVQPYNGTWWAGLAVAIDAQGYTKQALEAFRQAETLGGLDATLRHYIDDRIALLQGS